MREARLIRLRAAALLNGRGLWQDRISLNRSKPISTERGHSLLLYSREKTRDEAYDSEVDYKIVIRLGIELVVPEISGRSIDDDCEVMAEQVFSCLHLDPTFGGLVEDLFYEDSDYGQTHLGEHLHGSERMTFSMAFLKSWQEGDPSLCTQLRGIDIDWHLGTLGPVPALQDEIDLPPA